MTVELLSLLLAGCPSSPPEEADPAAPPVAPAPVVPNPAPARLIPPPPPDGLEPVTLVGHGLRIRVYPPFQVAVKSDILPAGDREEASDDLILSWWNVAEPGVGGLGGRKGLYNSFVVAGPVPDGPSPIQEVRHQNPDGSEVVRYRRGAEGSYVELAAELGGAGGMLVVEPGPADPRWAVQADGATTPLESRKILHSADPASGPGFELSGPQKPWGPWP